MLHYLHGSELHGPLRTCSSAGTCAGMGWCAPAMIMDTSPGMSGASKACLPVSSSNSTHLQQQQQYLKGQAIGGPQSLLPVTPCPGCPATFTPRWQQMLKESNNALLCHGAAVLLHW